MNITLGEILFYSGIVGMAAVAAISIITICVFSSAQKKLRHKFDSETRTKK